MYKFSLWNCRGIFAATIAVIMAGCWAGGAHATGEGAGMPINMTIKDAPVAEVLAMLSEASGLNIVVGQGVTGTLPSLHLRNVNVEDAVDAVARSMGLRWYKEAYGFIVTAQDVGPGVGLGLGERTSPAPAGPQPGPAVPGGARHAVGGTPAASAAPGLPTAVERSTGTPAVPAAGGPAAAASPAESPVGATVRIAPTVPLGPAVPPTALRGPQASSTGSAAPGQPQAPTAALSGFARTETPQRPPSDVGPAVSPQAPSTGLAPVPASRGFSPVTPSTPVAPVAPPAVGATRSAPAPAAQAPPQAVEQAPTPVSAAPQAAGEAQASAAAPGPAGETLELADAPAAPARRTPAGPEVHARQGSGTDRLVENTRTPGGGDASNVPTMIPINYASAADIALLLGGSVSRVNPGDSDRRLGRRERRAAEQRRDTDAFSALRGPGASDDYWMQQIDLGGGLGRGTGVGGQTRSGRTTGMGGTQTGMGMGMRPEGVDTIIAYMPQNALLVAGEPAAIDQLREVLALLDVPVKQVEISTKFIEVDVTRDDAMGIDWMVSNGSLEFFNLGFAPGEAVNNVVRWARGRFEATLGILKTQNKGRIVNEPHIVTQNNMPAYISFYTSIPYWTATITYNQFGQREVDYEQEEIDVEQTLEVTPRINADDTITMFLMPIMEDQGPDVIGPDGQRLPIIMTQELETQVNVADGETLALGGMIRKRDTLNTRFTPLLSDIPVIGKLFRSKYVSEQHSEMLIFVTPRILRELPPP